MYEIHKPRISITTIRLEYWILIFMSMFILLILISGEVIKSIVLASLPFLVWLVLYAAVHNPKRVFWVCLFVLPFIPYNWGIGITPSLPNMAPQRFLFFVIWLTYFIHRRKSRNEHALTLNLMDKLLIFLFIWMGISMFFATHEQGAYFRWPTRGMMIFMLFLVGKEMIRTLDDLWTVITIFAVQGFVMGLVGIIEAFSQFNIWLLLDTFMTPTWKKMSVEIYHDATILGKIVRIKGPYMHPVDYAQYLAFLLPFCIGIMARKKMLGIIAFSSVLPAIIFTQTRAAYLAVIVSLVVLMFFANRKIAVKVLVVVMLTGAIVAFFFPPYAIDIYENRILETVHSNGIYHDEMLSRLAGPEIILNAVVQERPFFGFGPQGYDGDFRKISPNGITLLNETSYAVMGAFEHGIPYGLGLEIYFCGIIVFMVYLVRISKKGKYLNKHGVFVIFLTAFAASFTTLHIETQGETLSNIIIVFAGIQNIYYHEKYILKCRDNR